MATMRRRSWRALTAPDLVDQFYLIVENAHIIKARDSKLLRQLRDYHGLDAIDVLWCIVEYARTDQPHDVQSFCRWCARTDPLAESERLQREAELAAAISRQRIPPAALVWYDLASEELNHPALVSAFRTAQQQLQSFANGVLGMPA